MNKILCVGESIIDFISLENGKNLVDSIRFRKCAGGSSANVAYGLSKFNVPVAFTGIIGNDDFGLFIENHLRNNNIDCTLLKKSGKFKTPVVFVSLNKKGENFFLFHRNFDLHKEYQFTKGDFKFAEKFNILHFSSVILRETSFKIQLTKLIKQIKFRNKGLIHFDTNIRFSLWDNMSQLRKTVNQFIEMSDIIKLSRKELYFVTEKDDIETSLNSFKKFKNKLIIITLDKEGSGYFYNGKFKMVSGFKVDAVDSTGAGDAFVSAFLYKLQDSNITDINASFDYLEKYLEQWLVFCNAAGCLNTMKHGATSGMTTKNKILSFINEYNEKNN